MSDNPACATGKIRLYVEAPLAEGGLVELDRDQRHYLINVMRQEEGAPVQLFNGRDGEWTAEIVQVTKKACALAPRAQAREQDAVPDVALWFAPVKKLRLDFLVQKATELGVASIRPVMTRRTNAGRVKDERMVANVIEAVEQCGRLTVPEVLDTLSLEEVLAAEPERRILFCDEGGDVRPIAEALAKGTPGASWAVLIGPEGGFAPEERDMLRAQDRVVPVSLGPRIMRADTAAIAALSLWQAHLGDW